MIRLRLRLALIVMPTGYTMHKGNKSHGYAPLAGTKPLSFWLRKFEALRRANPALPYDPDCPDCVQVRYHATHSRSPVAT